SNRFPNIGISSEMHYRSWLVRLKSRNQPLPIDEIALDQRSPADRLAMPARQIIENNRMVSGPRQRLAYMAPHIPCSAGDQNRKSHACRPVYGVASLQCSMSGAPCCMDIALRHTTE